MKRHGTTIRETLKLLFAGFLINLLGTASIFAQSVTTDQLKGLDFRNVGPNRGGRATTATGVIQEPGTFYVGSTGGGLWKTIDYGNSWHNVSDGYFTTPSLGAVSVAPSNPEIVYAGTGSDGLRSNVITGKGIYKSNDAGDSWEFIGLEKTGHIGAVEVDPKNPDRVFVAAIGNGFVPNEERGVYRTLDGGKSWDKVFYLSDTVGSSDLEFAPDNSQIIYAGMWHGQRKPWTIISGGTEGGIYKSADGGDTWKKLENGLPTGLIGKIDLAVSAAAPEVLYALVEAPEGVGGLYYSEDRGESFTLVSTEKGLLDRPFYYCNVDVNPQNPKTVFVSATRFFHSEDGGKNWTNIRTPHGDNHGVWIHPNDTTLWVQVNDGGANVTRDASENWSTQFNQPTAELYQVEVDDQFPYWLYAGQQDNYTTIAVPSLPPFGVQAGSNSYIINTGGCETGPAVPKPGNPDIVYANCKGRFGVFNKKTGQEMQYYVGASNMYGHNPKDLKFRFQRVSPVHVSPHNPDVVYHASQYLHKTVDEGKTWEIISPDLTAFTPETQVISGSPITRDITGEEFYSTIYAVKESIIKEGEIWVGANDGPVHVTKDGGKNWDNVTPKDLLPGGRVQTVEPSPHKEGKAYFAIYRYLLGDFKPYIYKTEDYGKSWELLTTGSNGIPSDYPARVIREDTEVEGLLYAGTDYGLFISFDDGKNWLPFENNLPLTPVTDIKIHQGDLVMSTMGRGFWILDDIQILRDLKNGVDKNTPQLFVTNEAYRLRYRDTDSESVPYFPEPGLTIDYYLPSNTDVAIEIYDDANNLVQSFENKVAAAKEKGERNMSTEFTPFGAGLTLSETAGAHRVVWDMRHVGPWSTNKRRSGNGGPMVTPGKYTVKLIADGKEVSKSTEIKIDPRVAEGGVTTADLEAQEELTLKVRELLTNVRKLENTVNMKVEGYKEAKRVKKKEKQTIEEIESQLTTVSGRYETPMLSDQTSYLYNMLERADQKPGKDAYDRYEELKKEYEALKEQGLNYLGSK
ncbi:WD40/YVTN/BNR-like repeat-containing protein [Chondrinema litorale]|uniref:WD40/YVTN/BNR-like repeat-containing protein n=1 Tax=Chondrinema litorale TaxID=2994555 RepID=UPI002542DB13|nr:hypothetical protein [Chondrinema litorale]UZR97844.1 hypothetical protein OQ292_28940 [Chondrinema litorale]